MKISEQVSWLFRTNAVINWVLSLRAVFDPLGAALAFGGPPPNYPFVIRLWSAFVFMFGCMFWEVARDPRGKAALLKYNWIEKALTALCVTAGYLMDEAPLRLLTLIIFTNWLWIPVILWADLALRRSLRAAS